MGAAAPRLALVVGAALVAVAWVAGTLPAGAGGAVTQEGWWNANPALPTSVPAAALAVGAQVGEADKVAAVGLGLGGPAAGAVDAAVLRLREAGEPGATVDPDGRAAITACPIVTPWSPARNESLARAPRADCGLARADGARLADGTWRFDLTAMARLWTSSLPEHGVLLQEGVEAPTTFQVSFAGLAAGGVALDVSTRPAPAAGTGRPAGGPATTGAGGAAPLAGPTAPRAGGAAPLAGPTAPLPGPLVAGPLPGPAPDPPGPAPPAPVAVPASSAPRVEVAARSPVGLAANLPAGTVLLVPLVLGLALVTSWVLGPAGDPLPARRRPGGVGRALAARPPPGRRGRPG